MNDRLKPVPDPSAPMPQDPREPGEIALDAAARLMPYTGGGDPRNPGEIANALQANVYATMAVAEELRALRGELSAWLNSEPDTLLGGLCRAESPSGDGVTPYTCTLPDGHTGWHQAAGSEPLVEWSGDGSMVGSHLCPAERENVRCTLQVGHEGWHVHRDGVHDPQTWPPAARCCPYARCAREPGHSGPHADTDGAHLHE